MTAATTLWARIELAGRTRIGMVDGETIRLHEGTLFDPGPVTGETVAVAEARWLTPTEPTKMVALWNNFRAAAEKNGWAIPAEPLTFLKAPNSYAAHGEPIRVPRSYEGRVAYEGELGIVIGKTCQAVSVAEAADHIFGYTCVNDVTALELLNRDPSFPQWTRAKNFDTFGVFGPVVATGLDPLTLTVRTLVNGRERQNYPITDMIFPPAELVSRISQDMTLVPGDVIACGTSLGVLPMKPGTVVEVAIDGIGALRNVFGGQPA
jgi:2-keto-4-pentenoate hydratase/2-oxohepta-3-ene-1,7-dioic acid hydratase in catechol pathway